MPKSGRNIGKAESKLDVTIKAFYGHVTDVTWLKSHPESKHSFTVLRTLISPKMHRGITVRTLGYDATPLGAVVVNYGQQKLAYKSYLTHYYEDHRTS
jgi:hypothetical protein